MKDFLKLICVHEWFYRFTLCYGGKSLGGGDRSTSTTQTDASTTVTTTNKQVGASEGSFAVGSDSTVNIQSLDADALKTMVEGNTDVSKTAITSTAQTAKDALNFGESALDNVRRTTESANDLLSRSYETYASKLHDNAGDNATTVAEKTQKVMLAGAGIFAAALIGFAFFSRPSAK